MISSRENNAGRIVGDAGFTLIELIVLLAILALVAELVVSYGAPRSHVLELKIIASQMASEMRRARAEAIAHNRPVAIELDLAHRSYSIDHGSLHPLPTGVSIKLLTIVNERISAARADILFNPDGSSTGGRVYLADGKLQIIVGVEWLTGQVTVTDGS